MHPDAAELWRLVDGELAPAVRAQLEAHVTACDSCSARLREQEASATAIARALRTIDHVSRPVRAGDLIARARSRRRNREIAVAAMLLLIATGASAAVPGSRLRRLVDRWIVARRPAAASVSTPPAPQTSRPAQSARATSGISFVPAGDASIDFVAAPTSGEIHIRVVDRAGVSITGTAADTRFDVSGHGVRVTPGGVGGFDVEISRLVERASVRVAGHVVYAKHGSDITSEGQFDSTGAVLVRFTSHPRSTP